MKDSELSKRKVLSGYSVHDSNDGGKRSTPLPPSLSKSLYGFQGVAQYLVTEKPVERLGRPVGQDG